MLKKTTLSLLTAVLILTGCASSKVPSQPQIPPLDSSLAANCPMLPEPPEGDYDKLTGWVLDVIGMYGDCAARHKQTAKLWSAL